MLYREIIAVCSQICAKHINTAVWAERKTIYKIGRGTGKERDYMAV
jgi:hypothetical protein